jgi:hypothetical protein
MNSERCLWIHLIILRSRLQLHAFKLRGLSQCWIVERLFFRSRSDFIFISIWFFTFFASRRRFFALGERSRDLIISDSWTRRRKSMISIWRSLSNLQIQVLIRNLTFEKKLFIFNENEHLLSTDFLLRIIVAESYESMTIQW